MEVCTAVFDRQHTPPHPITIFLFYNNLLSVFDKHTMRRSGHLVPIVDVHRVENRAVHGQQQATGPCMLCGTYHWSNFHQSKLKSLLPFRPLNTK